MRNSAIIMPFEINLSKSVIYSQQTALCQERTENELCLLTNSTDYKRILKHRLSG